MTIPARLLPISVTWVRPGATVDAYGNTVDDWDTVTSSPLDVMIEQRRTVEQRDGRDVTVTTLVLFTNELAVAAIDRFVWGDATYDVDGDPWIVQAPDGPHHVEAALLRVEG
jgi:hypothetical protein